MKWKNLSYTIKGGIIGLGILLILTLLLITVPNFCFIDDCLAFWELPFWFGFIFADMLLDMLFNNMPTSSSLLLDFYLEMMFESTTFYYIIVFLFGALPYFLIGTIIGFIVKKIKSRK